MKYNIKNLENQVENIYLGFPDLYGRLSTIKLNPDYFLKNIDSGFSIDSKFLNIDMVKNKINFRSLIFLEKIQNIQIEVLP